MGRSKGFLEENLAESQGKDVCRILFDGSPDAIFLGDAETGLILDANPAAEQLTGRPRSELIGLHQSQLHPPQREGASRRIFEEHVRMGGGESRGGPEYHYALRADGSEIPIEITARIIRIRGRRVLQGFFRDVSERLNAERHLLESEMKFKTLAERAGVGIYLIQDGLFRYANPEVARIFGYATEELVDRMGPADLVAREDAAAVEENINRRMQGKAVSISYGFRGKRKNGETLYIEVFGSRIDYLGKPAVIGTLLDVTERRRSQESLRESEERYRTLVDSAPVGIAVYREGRILFINRQLGRLAGVEDTSRFVGRNVLDFVHPDFRGQAAARIKALLSGEGQLPAAELKTLSPSGQVFDMQVLSVLIPFQGQECVMSIFQDITDRRRAEDSLQEAHKKLTEANQQLEHRVKERTLQLGELNKELEAFSYSAAHDMVAPLRRINIFSDLLEKESGPELTPEQRENIRMIHKSVSHMMGLVDGLLNLSTTGRKPLEKKPVVLSEVLGEVIADARSEASDRNIDWQTHPLPEVSCDRAMIRQVLANLISNAVKYTSSRETARIEVSSERRDGEYAVCVRDNGIGFSMEYSDKIFGVFQRLNKPEDFAGTGIGLSIVKRIISRHGGRVWAEGEPDKGAAFWFTLPSE